MLPVFFESLLPSSPASKQGSAVTPNRPSQMKGGYNRPGVSMEAWSPNRPSQKKGGYNSPSYGYPYPPPNRPSQMKF